MYISPANDVTSCDIDTAFVTQILFSSVYIHGDPTVNRDYLYSSGRLIRVRDPLPLPLDSKYHMFCFHIIKQNRV